MIGARLITGQASQKSAHSNDLHCHSLGHYYESDKICPQNNESSGLAMGWAEGANQTISPTEESPSFSSLHVQKGHTAASRT